MKLTWTQSNGGPLILMDQAALPYWRGVTNLEDPTASGTDYDRACGVQHSIEAIPIGADFSALVLGDEASMPPQP